MLPKQQDDATKNYYQFFGAGFKCRFMPILVIFQNTIATYGEAHGGLIERSDALIATGIIRMCVYSRCSIYVA